VNRSGYSYDLCDTWELIRWRGAVVSAIRGARGQALLREMAEVLDAMPVKRLIRGAFEHDGEVCALGAVAQARGTDVSDLDTKNRKQIALTFGIAEALAAEIMFWNDANFGCPSVTPERRWQIMRGWVAEAIAPEPRP